MTIPHIHSMRILMDDKDVRKMEENDERKKDPPGSYYFLLSHDSHQIS